MNNVGKRVVDKHKVLRFFSVPTSVAVNHCAGSDGIGQVRKLRIQ